MSNELHWGGINVKRLCKAIVSDIWMVFAVMAVTYLGLGIAGNMRNKPSYTSEAVVAVYPFNQMYTLEDSSSALETVMTVNEVINSEMFRTGLDERLTEPADYSLYSWQIDNSFVLMLSVSSSSPERAYQVLRAALDYYGEVSPHLAGDCQLEILTEPSFPTSPSNQSKFLKYRSSLTPLMGFAMSGFLFLMYAARKTYKTAAAVQKNYQNVRFFKVAASENNRRNKKKSGSTLKQETMRKTAMEVLQMLRANKDRSIFVTSAAHDEGKTDVTVSLARELADYGRSVLILETDSENTDISERLGMLDTLPECTLSALLQDGVLLGSVSAAIPDRSIWVISVMNDIQDEFVSHMAEDVEELLEQAEELADVILIDGCIWSESGDDRIWGKAADTSLAVCRQDIADFYAIDRMMTDLQENDSGFLGCVLYGF